MQAKTARPMLDSAGYQSYLLGRQVKVGSCDPRWAGVVLVRKKVEVNGCADWQYVSYRIQDGKSATPSSVFFFSGIFLQFVSDLVIQKGCR